MHVLEFRAEIPEEELRRSEPREKHSYAAAAVVIGALFAYAARNAPVNGLTIGPVQVAFDPQELNSISPARFITLANDGPANARIGPLTLTGANWTAYTYSLEACPGQTVQPGKPCRVEIHFHPVQQGIQSAKLEIGDASGEIVQSIALTGAGVAPQRPAPAVIELPLPPNLAPPVTPVRMPVVVSNPILAPPRGYRPVPALRPPIRPATASTPASAPTPATAPIKDAAPPPEPTPVPPAKIPAGVAIAQLEPSSIEFQPQTVKTFSERSVTLSNSGTAAFSVSMVRIEGDHLDDFAVTDDGCSWKSLSPREGCTIRVRFTPHDVGPHTAALAIFDNAGGGEQTAPLYGKGTPAPLPIATLQPNPVEFTNQVQERAVVLSNIGQAPLRAFLEPLTGRNPKDFEIVSNRCSGVALQRGDSCTIVVRFKAGVKASVRKTSEAVLSMEDNGQGSPHSVMLVGTFKSHPVRNTLIGTAIGVGIGVAIEEGTKDRPRRDDDYRPPRSRQPEQPTPGKTQPPPSTNTPPPNPAPKIASPSWGASRREELSRVPPKQPPDPPIR